MKRIGLILFFLFVAYFIFLIRQDIIDNLALRKEEELITKRLAQAEELGNKLRVRLSRFKNQDLVEEIARTKLGLIKKGETAYKVISNK